MVAPRPQSIALLKDFQSQIQIMIRDLSRLRFVSITGRQVEVHEGPAPDQFIYASYQTLIQLAARDLRLIFKAHYNIDDVKRLTQKSEGHQRNREQTLQATQDLFKEYSNLVAGGIAEQLQTCTILAGISLPLASTGFNEIISSDELRPDLYFDSWTLHGDSFAFVCTASLEIFASDLLDKYCYVAGDTSSGGEVEIL